MITRLRGSPYLFRHFQIIYSNAIIFLTGNWGNYWHTFSLHALAYTDPLYATYQSTGTGGGNSMEYQLHAHNDQKSSANGNHY